MIDENGETLPSRISTSSFLSKLKRLLVVSIFCNMSGNHGHDMTISENTSIRLGLLIAFLGLGLAGVIGAVWWAGSWSSSVNVKLDVILNEQKVNSTQFQALQTQLYELRKDFELHKAGARTTLSK